jgi:hypothetical protein
MRKLPKRPRFIQEELAFSQDVLDVEAAAIDN